MDLLTYNKLLSYKLPETPEELHLDHIILLAAEIFDTGIATINFSDRSEDEHGLYAMTIARDQITVVHDFNQDIRFYAGVKLATPDGFVIGTITVTDSIPHQQITEKQSRVLHLLAKMVIEKLESRLDHINEKNKAGENLRRLIHDLKNPMTSMSLYAQLLSAKEMPAEKVFIMAARIEKSINDIQKKLTIPEVDNDSLPSPQDI